MHACRVSVEVEGYDFFISLINLMFMHCRYKYFTLLDNYKSSLIKFLKWLSLTNILYIIDFNTDVCKLIIKVFKDH